MRNATNVYAVRTKPKRGKADLRVQSAADIQKQTQAMKQAIDSARGRELYGGRFATVEPVFGNIRHNKGLDRFTLRGQKKVDGQWKLFCRVHNVNPTEGSAEPFLDIEKLAHHGVAL